MCDLACAGDARARGAGGAGARAVGAADGVPGRTPGGNIRGRPPRTSAAARPGPLAPAPLAQRVGSRRLFRALGSSQLRPDFRAQHAPARPGSALRGCDGVARRRRSGRRRAGGAPHPRRGGCADLWGGDGAGVGDAVRQCRGAAFEAAAWAGGRGQGQPPLVAVPGALSNELTISESSHRGSLFPARAKCMPSPLSCTTAR